METLPGVDSQPETEDSPRAKIFASREKTRKLCYGSTEKTNFVRAIRGIPTAADKLWFRGFVSLAAHHLPSAAPAGGPFSLGSPR